jgi:hypothetical protein
MITPILNTDQSRDNAIPSYSGLSNPDIIVQSNL